MVLGDDARRNNARLKIIKVHPIVPVQRENEFSESDFF